MQPFILLSVFIFALIVIGMSIILVVTTRNMRTSQAPEIPGKHPYGYWMGIGIASGLPIGYLLALIMGLLIDNTSLFVVFGPALGMILGVSIGAALEQKHKNDIRPLTEEERYLRKRTVWSGGMLVLLGLLALVGVILLAAW